MQGQPSAIGPGTVLGTDFRIERPLGVGGMGSVYLAQQLSTGKPRAVKVMHPSLVSSTDMRDRFVQEARIGAMIPSDHVVEVVAAGVDAASGVPWLAMELLNGEDLSRYVARRGRLSVDELVAVLRPVFHALAAAHRQGIVHRDIKPENVFLATAQSSTAALVVKVLDFGIAKVAAQALGTATSAMGTPLWMAPEQSEQHAHVSPATDVWALGLLVFWVMTGKYYWRTAQAGTGSVPQLMREVLFEPMVSASERAREVAPGPPLPPTFDAWFARATARDPAQRFPDASAAGVDLFTNVLGVSASASMMNTAPSLSSPLTLPSAGSSEAGAAGASLRTPASLSPSGVSLPTPASYSPPGVSLPTPASYSPSGAGPLPAPSPMVSTITGPIAPAPESSSGAKWLLVGGGVVMALLLGVGAIIFVGGFLWLGTSDDSTPPTVTRPATASPVSTPGDIAPPVPTEPVLEPPIAPPSTATGPTKVPSPGPATTQEGTSPPPNTATDPPPKPKAAYSAGQKVDVSWGGSWWQGQVLKVNGDKYLVHYIGWASNWDEWVTTARLRPWSGTARSK
ncbi:MAG: protein kinase [Polyangiaceae bacterium]